MSSALCLPLWDWPNVWRCVDDLHSLFSRTRVAYYATWKTLNVNVTASFQVDRGNTGQISAGDAAQFLKKSGLSDSTLGKVKFNLLENGSRLDIGISQCLINPLLVYDILDLGFGWFGTKRLFGQEGNVVIYQLYLVKNVCEIVMRCDADVSMQTDYQALPQGFFIALRLVASAQGGNDISLNNLSQTLAPPKFVSNEWIAWFHNIKMVCIPQTAMCNSHYYSVVLFESWIWLASTL